MGVMMFWLRMPFRSLSARALRCGFLGAVLWATVAASAAAQVIGFEVPPSGGEGAFDCGYSGSTPTSCWNNLDRNPFDDIGALNTAAFRMDGDRVCGKADAPAHGGSCYISVMRNPNDGFTPTAPWDGSWANGAPDQQGQIFRVASTGTGARSITVFSRANPYPRYAGSPFYPQGYVGGDGLIRVYSRDSTAGTSGWTLLNTQVCTNTSAWAACTVNFTIPSTAQQVAFMLAPAPRVDTDRLAVDFDDVNVAGLYPALVARNDNYRVTAAGATTASVVVNDTANGTAAVVGTNVTVTPGTAPVPAQGAITMADDGTITIAPGTTPGTYSYPYQICALPALAPPVCASALAAITVVAQPTAVPTLGLWALLVLSCGLLLGYGARRHFY